MSPFQHLRDEFSHAWDALIDGWQRLYRRAAGAMTRFTHGAEAQADADAPNDLAERNTGWGVLAGEVLDGEDQIVVRLETPGMEKDDFDLEVVGDYLVVRGEKRVSQEETRGRWQITECAYGRFERAIPLPAPVASDEASASYDQGILRVELPKRQPRERGVKLSVS
ncbi:Hsp20/alpha crystallin family protein [Halochromatium glycolicum]|uniref:Heat-shock protein Hsp20 n=1 Tax=Halochromatium glycolicum TaxID=85075 RepID=A0AAJ0XAT3_9GAMM|nr:Hsp20/alpha crystallin family protein [Halochromatium glycolicum]MBK1705678.1 heat-shock protein Hsp20 [Halochromatium glycolicum]